MKIDDIILIADDNVGHAALIEKNLRRFGIKNKILKFEDGDTLVAFLNSNKDGSFLLIVDLKMPGMDGLSLLKVLKSDDKLKRMPVCIVTSSEDLDAVKDCVEYGCSAFVKKPISYDDFSESMRQLSVFLLQIDVAADDTGVENLDRRNRVLKDLIAKVEREKNSIKENIALNIEKDLIPIINEIKETKSCTNRNIAALENNLKYLSSSFYKNLFDRSASLTPAEVKICKMVKDGLQDKEIARQLSVSPATIQTHRKNIRRKLEITNKSINLRGYLEKLSE